MKNMDFSDFLPSGAGRIVHFGCRDGKTATHFRRIRPEVSYTGVAEDLPEEEIPGVDSLLSGMPEEAGESLLSGADCIIYEGTALSGLTPELLERHAACLPPGGQMVMVLGNPAYLGHFLAALSGKGLPDDLDVTLPGLQEMLAEAGLEACQVRRLLSREDESLWAEPAIQELLQAAVACQRGQGAEDADPRAVGYLVRAARKEEVRPLLIHSVLGEALVTARVRLLEPQAFCATEPGVRCGHSRQGEALPLADMGKSFERKLLIRQRMNFHTLEEARRQIQFLRKHGFLILFELDDNPVRWLEDYEETDWMDFRGSHACQVSTPALAEVVRQYNPHVKVFRNELRELPPQREYEDDAPVTVFFGALNREEDWKEILPAINEAAKKYGAGLRFRVLADKAFFAALETEHKEFVGDEGFCNGVFVPYPIYCSALHSADISLLPLRDTEFNRMKSDLKFIESAGHGAAVLASPTVYGESVRDGETGFLYRNSGEFAERLRLLVENRSKRLEIAEAAYRYVEQERLLSRHYGERLAWYGELLDRREELDRELLARMAGASEQNND